MMPADAAARTLYGKTDHCAQQYRQPWKNPINQRRQCHPEHGENDDRHDARPDLLLAIVDKPNSIALRIAMVAADEADLVATLRWGFEWDIAAAALIATEAGARVTDAFGQPLTFNTPSAQAFGVIACVPGIHAQVVDRLGERAKQLVM